METLTLDILQKAPQHQRARNTLVHVLAEREEYNAALKHALIILRENPASGVNHFNLGYLYENIEDQRRAEFHYRQALARQPSLWAAYLNLSNMLFEQGRHEDGREVLAQLRRRYGYHPMSYWVWGTELARQERWTEALQEFEAGLKVDPEEARLKLAVAVSLWELQIDAERSAQLFAEAIAEDVEQKIDFKSVPWKDFFSRTDIQTLLKERKAEK